MTKTASQLNGILSATVIYIENADGTYSPAGSATTGLPVAGVATAAAPTYSEGVPSTLSLDLAGNLRVIGSLSVTFPTPQLSIVVGNAAIATNQISVDTTSGGKLIAALRAGRGSITVVNHGTADVYIGASGVTTGTGLLLSGIKGASLTLQTSGAVYGIVASGSQTVSFVESY